MGGEQVIGGNSKTPGCESAFPFETVQMGNDLDQYLLGRVFCVGGQKEGPERQPIGLVLNPCHRLFKCVFVAFFGQDNQAFAAWFVRGCLFCRTRFAVIFACSPLSG